jgi:hypothetical protein
VAATAILAQHDDAITLSRHECGQGQCVPGEHVWLPLVPDVRRGRERRLVGDRAVQQRVPGEVDCDRPLRLRCGRCSFSTAIYCNGNTPAKCVPCSRRYRNDFVKSAMRGLASHPLASSAGTTATTPARPKKATHKRKSTSSGSGCPTGEARDLVSAEGVAGVLADAPAGGYLSFVTLTAPSHVGAHMMWSNGRRVLCRCTPIGGVDLAAWNASAGSRWNVLLTSLRRVGGGVEFVRVVEVQDGKRRQPDPDGDSAGRLALHNHLVVWSRVPLTKARVRHLAVLAGFGHEVDVQRIEHGQKSGAVAYMAKMIGYVTKSIDSRPDVPWFGPERDAARNLVADANGELVMVRNARATYRVHSRSRGWGCSMREVRAERRAYAVLMADLEKDDAERRHLQLAILACLDGLGATVISEGPAPPF